MSTKNQKPSKSELPVLILDNGLSYRGDILASVPHGHGVITWPNGDIFEGEFKHGKRHGQGKRTNRDGSSYVGQYELD
jgi:hypothetical protein